MEHESLAAWWPESDDPVAKAEGLPIFSPPPSIAELCGELVGGMDPAEWLEGEGALGLGDPMQGVEENSGVNGGNAGGKGCKNLMSERKRRERINRQMIALRSLVPYMSRVEELYRASTIDDRIINGHDFWHPYVRPQVADMDKRSTLIDAATYLQKLHKEIEEAKREIEEQEGCHERSSASSDSNLASSPDMNQLQLDYSSDHPQYRIYKIEVEEIEDQTLSVKLIFRKTRGAQTQVQRLIESLGARVTHTWTHMMDAQQMTTTSFLKLKKQVNLGAEMLKEQVSIAAIKMGFEVDLDDGINLSCMHASC